MPVAASRQLLCDGRKNVVMQFTGVSGDGIGEVNVIKVDASDLNPPAKSLAVKKITYDVSGGVVQLSWAADDPVPFALLSSFNALDYSLINGMTNGGGDTANGDILLTTLGFDSGSSYNITVEMRKKL